MPRSFTKTATVLGTAAALALGVALSGPPAQAERPAPAALERGRYLASIMDCGGCHTEGAMAGKPDLAHPLAGSSVGFQIPGLGTFWPPNLTPDRATGLGGWTEADLVRALRTGERPDGRILAPAMPWRAYATLTDADARALAGYLRSMPAVSHQVPAPIGADGVAPAPFLAVVAPALR